MTKNLLEIIHSGRILLADGAMGTELQKHGLTSNDCPEEFNITRGEVVQAIYQAYYDAGSDLVETNTFGGTRPRLQKYGFEKRVKEFSRRSAQLAWEVCPAGKFVAGSVGPTGEIFEPLGTLSSSTAFDMFSEQAEALAEGGVDIIFVETMMAIEEAETAVLAAKRATNLPVSATMTFELNDSKAITSWGVDIPTAVERLQQAGADLIGSNCGNGIAVIIQAIKEMQALTKLPLVAQPNAGIPEIIAGRIHYHLEPEEIKKHVGELIRYRPGVLGGCCGTNPDYIRLLRPLVDAFNQRIQ